MQFTECYTYVKTTLAFEVLQKTCVLEEKLEKYYTSCNPQLYYIKVGYNGVKNNIHVFRLFRSTGSHWFWEIVSMVTKKRLNIKQKPSETLCWNLRMYFLSYSICMVKIMKLWQ